MLKLPYTDCGTLRPSLIAMVTLVPSDGVLSRGSNLRFVAICSQSSVPDKKEHLYKVLVIGELGVGKTSIIKRYVHQFFSVHYRATVSAVITRFTALCDNWTRPLTMLVSCLLSLWLVVATAIALCERDRSSHVTNLDPSRADVSLFGVCESLFCLFCVKPFPVFLFIIA